MIFEGKAKISAKKEEKISKKIPVFYNSDMKLNRDVSIKLLDSASLTNMRIADPLAGTGVRTVRFLLELKKSKIKKALANDISKTAARNIKKNLKLNKCEKKAEVFNQEASNFLLENKPFDYIDIDPFGTPTPFLDAASKALSKNGILAVTATDTAALSGSAAKACLRKYWGKPLRNHLMHEIGIRLLIRRVQLSGTAHEKALTPIYSYSKLHYMRVFFKCSPKISEIDKIMSQHQMIEYCNSRFNTTIQESQFKKSKKQIQTAGEMWTGKLWDEKLASKISEKSENQLLKTISEEAKINTLGFSDTHFLSKKLKLSAPNLDSVIKSLKDQGFEAARTHFRDNGIRTNAENEKVAKTIKRMSKV